MTNQFWSDETGGPSVQYIYSIIREKCVSPLKSDLITHILIDLFIEGIIKGFTVNTKNKFIL